MVGVKSQDGSVAKSRMASSIAVVLMMFSLAACGNKEKAVSGQSLARVDGQDITVLQLNAELAQANVPAQQKDAASKKILDSLIDRQLLQEQAARDKIDRDPAVVSAIERAKAQIIAQAYLQRHLAKVARPTKEEINKYYLDHPDFFSDRKVYEFDQVVIASKDFGPELKANIGSTKSLDDVVSWIKAHHIEYLPTTVSNSSVDLPSGLVKRLNEMHKGQVFALQQNDKTIIAALKGVREAPIKPEVADPQIANFMQSQRNKETVEAELSRLRAAAKIEYLNKKLADASPAPASGAANGSATDDAAKKKDVNDDHTKRGVADL